ncbi:MAG: glycoside hydrolase family 127 protein, partial [Spirochaetaceae bacterium]|nr:glycoside hydrolase family 127 protein [Spirochaetaceae bacterium]
MNLSTCSEFIKLKDITINDSFWTPFMERVRTMVIPYQWEALNDRVPGAEPSGCMRNFKIAAQLTHPELDYGEDNSAGPRGFVFQDSDAAKWIEAAAYTLAWRPDEELEKTIDGAIDIICKAQQDDGYLNTWYIIKGLEGRFTNLRDNHELYCMGHFIEAAAAYYETTGKRKLLDAMIRYADCVDAHIGPEEGKLHGYPGHEIAEMALARLYQVTGDEKYLKLAKYFIDERGKRPCYFAEEERRRNAGKAADGTVEQYHYHQAHRPVREQRAAIGHAVRAVYLYSGMADVARLTGDGELLDACGRIWNNIVKRQMYITGAVGQSVHGEAFTFDYDLPNDTAYGETCAAIGLAFFARRMASITPRGVYGDILERTLFNAVLSGMSLDGQSFFYVNPLEVFPESCLKDQSRRHIKVERQKWFACACCPPNLARIITSLGSYVHSVNDRSVFTHLFTGSEARVSVGGKNVSVKIETDYPWEGRVDIGFTVEGGGGAAFTYGFRVPGWCRSYTVTLNGQDAACTTRDGYAFIDNEWRSGDRITVLFDMPVNFVEANPHVREDSGKTALMRGPVVYCLEEADNGTELFKIHAGNPGPKDVNVQFEKNLLEGVTSVSFKGKKLKDWEEDELYRCAADAVYEEKDLKWIP